jgi:16S rRNA (cytosine1402-N4)-methyltransferase
MNSIKTNNHIGEFDSITVPREDLDHDPVMLNEMLQYLAPRSGENFLDTTFGAGGYSRAILNSCECNVVSLDQDPTITKYVNDLKNQYKDRFSFIQSSFAEIFDKLHNTKFDGIVMDLGVSSMQLDLGERGFSFAKDGPLDMRMSNDGMSASDFVNSASEEDIANIIYQYGDEVFSRKIAKKIIEERQKEPILTTLRLANIVRSSIFGRKGKIDPATKTFQAIRIHVNDELGELTRFLSKVKQILTLNGRLIIVSFHSLEDRIIKNFLKDNSQKVVAQSKYAKEKQIIEREKWLKILTKKALIPSKNEIKLNPRSRSAKLRAAIKIGEDYVS